MVKYIKSILIGFLTIIFFYAIQFIGNSIFLICNFKNPLNYLRFLNHSHVSVNEIALLILFSILCLFFLINYNSLNIKIN